MIVTAWRIVQERHLDSAFSGECARRFPGRWNERGIPLVYTAESLALAAMEMLVHVAETDVLDRYVCIPIRFDNRFCQRLDASELPSDWTATPAPVSTRALGTRWVVRASSPILAVPSCLVPVESLFLLNPQHPDFRKLMIGQVDSFRFDPRLFKLGLDQKRSGE